MSGCKTLFLDIETFSSVDIAAAGSYKYIESPDFEILLIAYAWNEGPVNVLDLTDPLIDSSSIREALQNPTIRKVAHNAHGFERQAFHRWLGKYMSPEEWTDTMLLCAQNGLPMSLDAAGAALELKQQKIKEGTSLISYFCKPCRPTVSNGGRTRNLPEHAPDKWARFVGYCQRDVEVMQQIYYRLRGRVRMPDWEREVEALDARINERGILIDTELAASAVTVDAAEREANLQEMRLLTGLENPNSPAQLLSWLHGLGLSVDRIDKATVAALRGKDFGQKVDRVLELRQLLGKTSTKKYSTMLEAACSDCRIRGTMQYYGAGRTGRWAGRLLQVQNLPQNHLENIGAVRQLVKERDLEALEMLYRSVPDVLSQLIRTGLVAEPGCTFLVADYSAIEARVIAYLAGEEWRMKVFSEGGDIYCSSASQMFKVPVEKHGQNAHLRQKGKVAELACGYGGGTNALLAFGADKLGLTEAEMKSIVEQWRAASPTIPAFWRSCEKAAKDALLRPGHKTKVLRKDGYVVAVYWRDSDALRCQLPSGRVLSYWKARLDDEGTIYFLTQNQMSRKWDWSKTWGGKLVENIVQAFARDCLAWAMLRLDALGYRICFGVHDELICEEPKDGRSWRDMAAVMGWELSWAPGLLLRAEGYSTDFYMKD